MDVMRAFVENYYGDPEDFECAEFDEERERRYEQTLDLNDLEPPEEERGTK